MSVESEILRIRNKVADSYLAVATKGGSIPTQQTLANLPGAISSISSGASLNVVAYASEFPETAEENTIGFISSTPANGYVVQDSEPTSGLVNGMVWIRTGVGSPAPIMLTNEVYLYPIGAKQCVPSILTAGYMWIDIEAKTYRSGKWTSWIKYLFNRGEPTGYTWNHEGIGSSAVTDRMVLGSGGGSRYGVDAVIHFGGYHYLCLDYVSTAYSASYLSDFGFNGSYDISSGSAPDIVSRKWEKGTTVSKLDLTTAASEDGYIKIVFAQQNRGEIYKVWLEG